MDRALLILAGLTVVGACTPTIPSERFACDPASADPAQCPEGFRCRADGLCVSTPSMDASMDARSDGATDAPTGDAGTLVTYGKIAAGEGHVCVIGDGGSVWCWGRNDAGQVGDGTADRPTPVRVDGLTGVAQIAAGDAFSCARLSDGTVRCWGSKSNGRLGIDGSGAEPLPIELPEVTDAFAIATGGGFGLACVRGEPPMFGWGQSSEGQLIEMSGAVFPPVEVPVGIPCLRLIAREKTSCMIDTTDRLICWGDNHDGELGDLLMRDTCGTSNCSRSPVDLGFESVRAATLGVQFGCASHGEGVSCWGDNEFGQLGIGTSGDNQEKTIWEGATRFVSVAAGDDHACGVTDGGAVLCWGSDALDQLGPAAAPTETCAGAPCATTAVSTGVVGALHVVATDTSTCVLTAMDVRCWGGNGDGELGRGAVSTSSPDVESVIAVAL